jgi:DNA-binding NtrC family response regulator
LESVPDIGTLFSIYLPAAQPWEDPYAINGSQVTPPIALIALPESLMRDQFVEGLKKQGYTPIIVNNATETLDLFWTESELLGLIVCATSIFEMKATTLITHMHEYNASVPVILLTDVEAMQQLSGMTPREYKVLSDTSDAQTLLDAVQKISGGQLSGNRV